jgi:hypothetical protein
LDLVQTSHIQSYSPRLCKYFLLRQACPTQNGSHEGVKKQETSSLFWYSKIHTQPRVIYTSILSTTALDLDKFSCKGRCNYHFLSLHSSKYRLSFGWDNIHPRTMSSSSQKQQQQQDEELELKQVHSKTLGKGGIISNDLNNSMAESEIIFNPSENEENEMVFSTEAATTTSSTTTVPVTNRADDGRLNKHSSDTDADEGLTTKNDEDGETSSEDNPRRFATGTEKDQHDEEGGGGSRKKHGVGHIPKKVVRKTIHHGTHWWTLLWSKNPRIAATIFRIVIPMSILLGSAALGGWVLARLEVGAEFDQNDQIMVARHYIEKFDVDSAANALTELPILCLDTYYNRTLEGTDLIPELLEADVNITTPENITDYTGDFDIAPAYLWDLREHMVNCSTRSELLLAVVRRLSDSQELALAIEDLSFNWGRCWNRSEFGDYLSWSPTPSQLKGAKTQGEFYAETWRQNQQDLFWQYLDELGDNITENDEEVALNRSLVEATGRTPCETNRAGTTWFFFTVMTTIGTYQYVS